MKTPPTNPNATTPTSIVENDLRPFVVEVVFRVRIEAEDEFYALRAAEKLVSSVCNPLLVEAEVIHPQS